MLHLPRWRIRGQTFIVVYPTFCLQDSESDSDDEMPAQVAVKKHPEVVKKKVVKVPVKEESSEEDSSDDSDDSDESDSDGNCYMNMYIFSLCMESVQQLRWQDVYQEQSTINHYAVPVFYIQFSIIIF